MWIKTHEVVNVSITIEYIEFGDGPTPYWEAYCPQLKIKSTGGSNAEARDNLIKEFYKNTFLPKPDHT